MQMQLLVIRHALAGDSEEWIAAGQDDDLRPLTKEGRKRMRAGAAGLHRLVAGIDVLATSPLVRARQTAELVAAEFDVPEVADIDCLRPDARHSAFLSWLRAVPAAGTVAIVGHRPHLHELVSWLLTGTAEPFVEMKKGAAIMLDFGARARGRPRPGTATLLWALAPAQLRRLGE
jgi:phosphohistidine phosphatase